MEKMIEKVESSDLTGLTQDSGKHLKLSPTEEYQKSLKKRKNNTYLFVLLLVIELAVCVLFLKGIEQNDLQYRVSKQIENSFTGKNKFSTGIYTGETDFGYLFGDAVFEYATGTVYDGQWTENQMQGIGTLKVPSEGIYEGNFIQSQKSGAGVFTWDDGTVYDGEWKNDQMNGQGTYVTPDKVEYTGTFKENRFQSGTCSFSNETGKYIAEYKDFSIDNLDVSFTDGTVYNGACDGTAIAGIGTMQFPNGDEYSGDFAADVRSGQGTYTWSNGDKYDGSWDNDSMSGTGVYTYLDGSCAQGEFQDNIFINGAYTVVTPFGEYDFTIRNSEAVGVKMVLTSGTTYTGDLTDGKLTGSANITYSNGDKYSGRVLNGYKNGQGTYLWSSGASYDGDWVDDKMAGKGTYIYPQKENGYKLSGTFENGVPNGKCQYYVSKTEAYETDWKNGECVKIYE